MAVDNTHTKYLRGADKKAWNSYGEAYKAQNKLDKFFEGLNAPTLKAGEEYEIPLKSKRNKNKNKNNETSK